VSEGTTERDLADRSDGPEKILVVRHGETDWNCESRIQGWAPTPLNDRGHRQATALGEVLAESYDVDEVVASDLRRTRETAARIAEAGLPTATFDDAWRERSFGHLQGMLGTDLFEQYPEFDVTNGSADALQAEPPGGEALVDVYRRVIDGWNALRDLDADTVLVVSHGGPLHLLHGHVAGEDLRTAYRNHSHDNCALSEFRLDGAGDGIEVVCKNECRWTLDDGPGTD